MECRMAWIVAIPATQRCSSRNVEWLQSVTQNRMLLRLEYNISSGRFAKLKTPTRFATSVIISLRTLSGFHAFGCDER